MKVGRREMMKIIAASMTGAGRVLSRSKLGPLSLATGASPLWVGEVKARNGEHSLRKAWAETGRPLDWSLATTFQSYPHSLREFIRVAELRTPGLGALSTDPDYFHSFEEENAQGIVYARDNIWFLSSEKRVFRYRFEGTDPAHPRSVRRELNVALRDLIATAGLDPQLYNHIGDLAYADGLVFAPVRHLEVTRPPHLILAMSEDLELVGWAKLSSSANEATCAINPWNALLYVDSSVSRGELEAYDVGEFLDRLPNRSRWGQVVPMPRRTDAGFRLLNVDGTRDAQGGIQGVAFSSNGRVYVTRSIGHTRLNNRTIAWRNYVYAYSALTGVKLSTSGNIDFQGDSDEVEGVSIHPGGVVYIAVADNDFWDTDDFDLYAFRVQGMRADEI